MKKENQTYRVAEYELNIMNDPVMSDVMETEAGGVLFLFSDKSFHQFSESACIMWNIISRNSDYVVAEREIMATFVGVDASEIVEDIYSFFDYLTEIGAIILNKVETSIQ